MLDGMSEALWRCAPCWYRTGIARGRRRLWRALSEHMARRGEMEHQSLAVFVVCMSGSPPEFYESGL